MKELYCGIDTHKDSFAGCIMEKDRTIVREHSFPSTKEGVDKFICGIPSSQMKVAIEACGIWRGPYKILESMGYEVKLASPKKTHDIACKKKTDKVDTEFRQHLYTRDNPGVPDIRRQCNSFHGTHCDCDDRITC